MSDQVDEEFVALDLGLAEPIRVKRSALGGRFYTHVVRDEEED